MEGLIEANTVTEKHGCVFLQDKTIIRSKKYFDEIKIAKTLFLSLIHI